MLEIKNTTTEMETALNEIINKLNSDEERISELKDVN